MNADLTARIVTFIRRYRMFEAGGQVGVAVSGGADSMCLLHFLQELAADWDLRLVVLHLNHQLRAAESDGDAEFVRQSAERLGLECRIESADVGRLSQETGENLEQAGRSARYGFFRRSLDAGLVDRVATGHTRSDQAETVLYRFLRGAGTAGLSGVRPVTSDGFVRPILCIGRDEVELYLRERNILWREDASNLSRDFARNRIRHDLIPLLLQENPALVDTLADTAEWAVAEEDWWTAEVAKYGLNTPVGQPVVLSSDEIHNLHVALARRLIREAIRRVKGDLRGISFRHVEQIRALCMSELGSGRVQIPAVDILRSFDSVRLAPMGDYSLENRNYRFALDVGRSIAVPGGTREILLELIENSSTLNSADCVYNDYVGCLDGDRLPGPLSLRNWRPGDQYHPAGRAGSERIKLLFQEARIPLWERRSWPVITSGDDIVWSRQFGCAQEFVAGPATRRVLRVRESGN